MIPFNRSAQIINSLSAIIVILVSFSSFGQSKDDCLMCHEDKALRGTKNGRSFSVFVDAKKLAASIHPDLECITCHQDLEGTEFPHTDNVKKAQCTPCHDDAQKLFDEGIHGKAYKSGDRLAPNCQTCHGSHSITKVNDPKSAVAPIKIPFLCGSCHKEGTPVQVQRKIPEDHILENYSESMHGDGLLKKGLSVAATCASCHSPHRILPHTDPRSTIAKQNIAATCTKCHMEIEAVHRKIIKGELWEKQEHVLPVCVDCHQPHKVRSAFYEQGLADGDCLRCHNDVNLKSKIDGHSEYVDYDKLQSSIHAKIACSQCHSNVDQTKLRPCEGMNAKVDCASCHAEVGDEYKTSTHGTLHAKNDLNAPFCTDCHGTHSVLGKKDTKSPIFSPNIPKLCAKCHREGEKAALKYNGPEKNIVNSYVESIHGKGLMKSGLTVTATCTDCHTAHHELPHTDSSSSINPKNIANTCGNCHYGIKDKFNKSVHSPLVTHTDKPLPVCNTCHSAHNIVRTDLSGFRLEIMNTCGHCHEEIAKTYFDTYHGKVSQLGYSKTAKCYDCHGSHEILKVTDPESHLSRQNILATCQKCHQTATKQFAGYFTHATHHDPRKYPWLFWTFWGMTGLLVVTFVLAGAHTLLWLPRSLQYKRELKKKKAEKNNIKYTDSDTKE
jgi:predicted CXXCH cytochrome family protein